MAGALAEKGMELEEITKRVSMIAKTMGECQSRDGKTVTDMGTQSSLLTAVPGAFPSYFLEARGRSSGESLAALGLDSLPKMKSWTACLEKRMPMARASLALLLPSCCLLPTTEPPSLLCFIFPRYPGGELVFLQCPWCHTHL